MEKRSITKELILKYQNELLWQEHSTATISKYGRDLRFFAGWLAREYAGIISKEIIIAYKATLTQRYAAASVNSMLAAVNGYLAYMGWHECRVKPLKIQKNNYLEKERELSREEYRRLLKAAERREDKRLFYLLQTICSTGIRVSELQFITVQALQNRKTEVSNKGKFRIVYLPSRLCTMLKRYCQKKGIQQGSVFVTRTGRPLDRSNIWAMMKRLCKEAGVAAQKVFPHNLRHLFARTFYQLEHDLDRLATVLGHSNVNTTRIYTHCGGAGQQQQIERLRLLL